MSQTVLVVDDHAGFRAKARLLLEADGYEVIGEAADAQTAVAEASRLRPEVVLLDVQLPDGDGFDVAARITEGEAAPAVVLTSSRDWSDSAELILRSGARGFLPKDQLSGGATGGAAGVRSLRLALVGLGLAGFTAGLVTLPLALASDFLGDDKAAHAIFGPLITWSFVGTGLYAWWRRPGNNFGPLMTAIGFVWAVSALEASEVEGLFIIGLLVAPLAYALFLHMLVAFPTGRLQTPVERLLVGIGYFDTTVIQVLALLFHQTAGEDDYCNADCPANPLLISDQPGFSDAMFGLQAVIGVFGLTAIAILLVRRWRAASPTQRRALAPVLLGGRGDAGPAQPQPARRRQRLAGRGGGERHRHREPLPDGLGSVRVSGGAAALAPVAGVRRQRLGRAPRRGRPSPKSARGAR